MSATGFHPDPSAKAPWTRTMVLTAACAGNDAARAAPAIRAKINRIMLQVSNIVTSILIIGSGARTVRAELGKRYRDKPALPAQILRSKRIMTYETTAPTGAYFWAIQLSQKARRALAAHKPMVIRFGG